MASLFGLRVVLVRRARALCSSPLQLRFMSKGTTNKASFLELNWNPVVLEHHVG